MVWIGAATYRGRGKHSRELVETLLKKHPLHPLSPRTTNSENILQQMIERYTILDSEANNLVRRQGRLWEMVGMEDKRLTVSNAQRERLIYVVIRDLIRNGPLEPLLSDEMLEDIHSVGSQAHSHGPQGVRHGHLQHSIP